MASGTGSPVLADVPIKYESPYHAESLSSIPEPAQSPTLKRERSHEAATDEASKRQRISPITPQQDTSLADDDDFAMLLARATSSTTQQISSVSAGQGRTNSHRDINQDEVKSEGYGQGFADAPQQYMRILSLPILESLSTQILSTLVRGPYSDTIKIITEPKSELGQAYATLKSLFDQTKKIYSQLNPFLSADEFNIQETEHRTTIRTTNLATFVSSVFGGQDVGFYELNDHFIETFTPDDQPFGRVPGQLFLNLKTQMYLSVTSQEEQERAKEDILEDLFPIGMEEMLLTRHPNIPLSGDELEFVESSRERREYLMKAPGDVDTIQTLSEKFAWEEFLRSLSVYLSQAYEPLLAPYMRRHALTAPAPAVKVLPRPTISPLRSIETDISIDTERAVQAALKSISSRQNREDQQENSHVSESQSHAASPHSPFDTHRSGSSVPPTQSAPTQVLYEQARQAAVAKANPGSARRPGLPSQRRPWTTDEENTLMAGLDQVKGPHWSSILTMYGPSGTVNEVLKDRNQVQLKDKARNLKLFFLKSNIEVPYYLQCVTGELKTRAPSQAARKEAEERARLAGDEEQVRMNGILTLANGMQTQSPAHGSGSEVGQALSSPAHSLQSYYSQDQEGLEEFQVEEMVKEEHGAGEEVVVQKSGEEMLLERIRAANASAAAASSGGGGGNDGQGNTVQRSGFTAVAT